LFKCSAELESFLIGVKAASKQDFRGRPAMDIIPEHGLPKLLIGYLLDGVSFVAQFRSTPKPTPLSKPKYEERDLILETLCRIIDGKLSGLGDGIQVDLAKKEIVFYTTVLKPHLPNVEMNKIGRILKTEFVLREKITEKNGLRSRWKSLNCVALLREAKANGWPCATLSKVVRA
jgi:hypothetical protein